MGSRWGKPRDDKDLAWEVYDPNYRGEGTGKTLSRHSTEALARKACANANKWGSPNAIVRRRPSE